MGRQMCHNTHSVAIYILHCVFIYLTMYLYINAMHRYIYISICIYICKHLIQTVSCQVCQNLVPSLFSLFSLLCLYITLYIYISHRWILLYHPMYLYITLCIYIQLISLNWNLVNWNFRKWVGCEALAPIEDNGSL